MKERILVLMFSLCSSLFCMAQIKGPQANEYVELMSILARSAEYQEYNMDLAGEYITDIDRHFKAYLNHPAVNCMKELRKKNGISYDAVISMAIHMQYKDQTFCLIEEETNTLDKRWEKVNKEEFFSLLTRFYQESCFNGFYKAHKALYDKGIAAYKEKVSKHLNTDWYTSFYGKEPQETYNIIIGFCNGTNNYGSNRQIKGKQKEIFAIVDYSVNKNQEPQYNKWYLSILIHEFNHSFTNYLLDNNPNNIKALTNAGKYLYNILKWSMRQQAYGNWKIMINESLVRAAVICYLIDNHYTQEEIEKEICEQLGYNFPWMPELVTLLRSYRSQQDKFGSLEAFYPQIISFFNDYASKEKERISKAIKL